MAYASKSRATGYTDYFKKNTSASDDEEMSETITPDTSDMTMVEKRKAALRRRLQTKKAGK